MENNARMLIGIAELVGTSLLTFSLWSWLQDRAHLMDTWVRDFLLGRYEELPNRPCMMRAHAFARPAVVNTGRTGIRHGRDSSTWAH